MDSESKDALRLSFEEIRTREQFQELKSFLRIACSFISAPLFLIFWFADLVFAPDLKWQFLALRFVVVFVNFAIFNYVKRDISILKLQSYGTIFTIVNSFAITLMTFMTGGWASEYYAGLGLVTGIIAFIPWTNRFLAINTSIIILPYTLFGWVGFDMQSWRQAYNNVFFLIGILVVSLFIRHFTEKLRQQDAKSKFDLNQEILSRGRTIKEKTNEAIKLRELANQFSPQVVQAINSGKLDIYSSIKESQICAIFVDIVNSTSKVVSIDKDHLAIVISRFMDDTMKVLLKYDITIDKFLGDGVLAFSNAPMDQQNFAERVVDAALEIIQVMELYQDFYKTYWGGALEVRVGIAQGNANVGFYGQNLTVKSYTALGEVVNLACRLSDKASPNEILVCSTTADSISHDKYQMLSLGNLNLKGFDKKDVSVFNVIGAKVRKNTSETDSLTYCSKGHGLMHLDVNAQGIYEYQCRVCQAEVLAGKSDDTIEEEEEWVNPFLKAS